MVVAIPLAAVGAVYCQSTCQDQSSENIDSPSSSAICGGHIASCAADEPNTLDASQQYQRIEKGQNIRQER